MAAAAILDWLGGYLDQSRIVIGGLYRYATFGWNRCSIFDNMEVLIFCTFGLKTLIQAPKIGVFGRYDSLNGVRYQRRRHILGRKDVVRRIDRQNRSTGLPMRPVGVPKKPKKERKTKKETQQWQTDYSPRPPTSSDRNAVRRGGWSSGD